MEIHEKTKSINNRHRRIRIPGHWYRPDLKRVYRRKLPKVNERYTYTDKETHRTLNRTRNVYYN